jgi:hypothetical protein
MAGRRTAVLSAELHACFSALHAGVGLSLCIVTIEKKRIEPFVRVVQIGLIGDVMQIRHAKMKWQMQDRGERQMWTFVRTELELHQNSILF